MGLVHSYYGNSVYDDAPVIVQRNTAVEGECRVGKDPSATVQRVYIQEINTGTYSFVVSRALSYIKEFLSDKAGVILDIGAGNGYNTRLISEEIDRKIIAVDVNRYSPSYYNVEQCTGKHAIFKYKPDIITVLFPPLDSMMLMDVLSDYSYLLNRSGSSSNYFIFISATDPVIDNAFDKDWVREVNVLLHSDKITGDMIYLRCYKSKSHE